MARVIATTPPYLYEALKAEGFELPKECGDVQLLMPVAGIFQLSYIVNLTDDDVARIGRALTRYALQETALTKCSGTHAGPRCADTSDRYQWEVDEWREKFNDVQAKLDANQKDYLAATARRG